MKKNIRVVGGILENYKGEILCTLRNKDSLFGNLWELPGGKIELGESSENALEREILEELNVRIKVKDLFLQVEKEYDDFIINLQCFKCEVISDIDITPMVHDKIMWLNKENLISLKWIPTDIPIIEKIIKENK